MKNNDRITQWINTILDELSKLDDNKGIKILYKCGEQCSRSTELLKGAVKIRNDYTGNNDPDTLFEAFKSAYYNTSNLIKDGNKIILTFEECTCPIAGEGVTDPYLCNCTVGYTKNIFETLFNRAIEVDLERSILKGDRICKQVISIGDRL